MSSDLPYRAEYSKSGRAGCKCCKLPIGKDTLRLAAMVQSPFFDGKQPNWYHHSCFFVKQKPQTAGDIAHIDSLRWEDQEMIKKKIAEGGGGGSKSGTNGAAAAAPAKGKAKKRAAPAATKASGEFKVEYSKSSRALCRGCEEKIMKDEVRVSKKDYETEDARKYGGLDLWHHLDCFVKLRDELCFWDAGATLPGYKDMEDEDKKCIKVKLPIKEPKVVVKDEVDGVVAKKAKSEEGSSSKVQEQNRELFKYRDFLKNNLNKRKMVEILTRNKQEIPPGEERVLDRLSDIMTFGRLTPCTKCNGGQLVYRSNVGYQCQGDLTEWVKCQDINLDPERVKCTIPSSLKEEYAFLNSYKCKPSKREIVILQASASTASAASGGDMVDGKSAGPKLVRIVPLKNMEVVLLGTVKMTKEEVKSRVTQLGGKLVTKIHDKLGFVIASKDEVEKMSKRMCDVQEADVQVVSEDILDLVKGMPQSDVFDVIKKKSICDWGTDPKSRIPLEVAGKSGSKNKSGSSQYNLSKSTVKLQLKGGAYVDPDSDLADRAHVYKHKGEYYNAVLGLTDIQTNKNSYYKMQILEADDSNKFWLFRSWGRIGTTIGGSKAGKVDSLNEAIQQFEELYLEKSGNKWSKRKDFVKRAGLMYPVDVDYGESEGPAKIEESDLPCNLDKPVQDLVRMLFDVDTMKKTMLEFELDMDKMPLGKISQKQLKQAYSLLTDLQQAVIESKSTPVFLDLSNRFYTLIPHSFGIDNPPILNTDEIIKTKIDMVASLMEIEIAYKLLSSGSSEGKHPIETHYEQLNTTIDVLDKTSEEFVMLQKYVRNTHASTHTQYDLEIEEIFKVSRLNEAKRYKPYKQKLTNRKLLWHGSRITNFAGILSQGLRIAPPEAPASGYMFGKGIYFADMVSKSANYCFTSKTNPTGLLLLCEVALGKICERTKAESFSKPPSTYHSVKGMGMTEPDPSQDHVKPDGLQVPLGTSTKTNKECSLLYNEYIVYDPCQLEMQYLLKMKFNHKY